MAKHSGLRALTIAALVCAVGCSDSETTNDEASTTGATTSMGGQGPGGASSNGGNGNGGDGAGGSADTTAPGPVTTLTATVNEVGNSIDLSWSNPADADLAGVLIIRSEAGAAATFAPVDGTPYSVDDEPATDELVAFAGMGTTSTTTSPVPGLRYHYAAWAYDAALNYSTIELTDARKNSLGPQTGQIEIADDGTVTINTQPTNFTLSGTAINVAGDVVVDLKVQNDTARIVFNAKVVATTVSDGTFVGDVETAGATFPPNGGDPFSYYGPEALELAAPVGRDIDITGITTFPVTIDLSIVDSAMLFGTLGNQGGRGELYYVDSSGAADASDAPFEYATAYTVAEGALREPAISPDGRTVYAGSKASAIVSAFDTVTNTFTESVDFSLDGQHVGSVGGVALSADGTHLYAVVNDGRHWRGGNNAAVEGEGPHNDGGTADALSSVTIHDLDPSTLASNQSLTLITDSGFDEAGQQITISADGSMMAVVVSASNVGQLWLIDAATFTIIDADPGTGGSQPVTLSSNKPAVVALNPNGTTAYVGFRTGGDLEMVDTAAFTTTVITPTAQLGQRVTSIVAANGKVYVGTRTGAGGGESVVTYDETGANETIIDSGDLACFGVAVSSDGSRYYLSMSDTAAGTSTYRDIAVYDAITDLEIDMDADGAQIDPIYALGFPRDHGFIVSPF